MTTTHSPGPWHVSGSLVISSDRKRTIADCSWGGTEREHNVRLIAAAPQMLEALEQLVDDMRGGHSVCEQAKQMAIAAVRAAGGEVVD